MLRRTPLPERAADLRRAALGYIRLVQANNLKLAIDTVVHAWDSQPNAALAEKLTIFLLDRLAVQLRDEGNPSLLYYLRS